MGFQHKKVKVGNVIIEIEGLVKHYGEVKAVDGVSFSVEKGETFGLLGPNGAGKTVPTFENSFPCQLELDCFSKTV